MYSLIIGLSPSKGARSPILWNKAYKYFNIDCRMKACDIANDKDLIELFNELSFDSSFQGGSVAFPYKEKVSSILSTSIRDKATLKLGAVNSIYKNDLGVLCGANTDGIAALNCIENVFFSGGKKPKNIIILGIGGVGKAVLAFVHDSLLPKYDQIELYASSRTHDRNFLSKFNETNFITWKDRHSLINKETLIINCTSLGDYENLNSSPIEFSYFNDSNLPFGVYDVIYNPYESKLIRWTKNNNLLYSNGLEMNLLQAAYAFKSTVNIQNNVNDIKNIMSLS